MRLVLALLLTLGIIAIACSDDEGGSPPPVEGTKSVTDLGIGIIEIATGVGTEATSGDRVEVHYTGWLSDGTKFDSSVDRNQTFTFRLNNGDVIAGWDDGVAGMAQGGIRRLVIPPEFAYGDRGSGDTIPAGAELTFDIELVSLTQCELPDASPQPVEGDRFTTENGVTVIVIATSDDDPVRVGDVVAVNYTGWLAVDGTMFDSSLDRCEVFNFTLGLGNVIQGWEEGVLGMSPGEVRRLFVPPELAYGDQGSGSIPPGSTLIFDVELIGFGRQSPVDDEAIDEGAE